MPNAINSDNLVAPSFLLPADFMTALYCFHPQYYADCIRFMNKFGSLTVQV